MSDGECVERLWANLRNFASMTKEMRPAHRTDVLSDALQHYRQKSTEKIGTKYIMYVVLVTPFKKFTGHLLCKRMEHAMKLHSEATRILSTLKEDSLCMHICLIFQ